MFHSFHFANQVFGLREHEIRRGCAPGRHRGPGLRRGTDLPRNGDACTGNYRGLGDWVTMRSVIGACIVMGVPRSSWMGWKIR